MASYTDSLGHVKSGSGKNVQQSVGRNDAIRYHIVTLYQDTPSAWVHVGLGTMLGLALVFLPTSVSHEIRTQ